MFKWEQVGATTHKAILNERLKLDVIIEEPLYHNRPYVARIVREYNPLFSTELPDMIDTLDEAKEHTGFALFCRIEQEIQTLKVLKEYLNEANKDV